MSPEQDARACGQFARSLAAETFQRHSVEAMRDHDEVVRHWKERPGFMDGYRETAQ